MVQDISSSGLGGKAIAIILFILIKLLTIYDFIQASELHSPDQLFYELRRLQMKCNNIKSITNF